MVFHFVFHFAFHSEYDWEILMVNILYYDFYVYIFCRSYEKFHLSQWFYVKDFRLIVKINNTNIIITIQIWISMVDVISSLVLELMTI